MAATCGARFATPFLTFKVSKVIEAFKRLRRGYKPRLAKAMRFTSVQHILLGVFYFLRVTLVLSHHYAYKNNRIKMNKLYVSKSMRILYADFNLGTR